MSMPEYPCYVQLWIESRQWELGTNVAANVEKEQLGPPVSYALCSRGPEPCFPGCCTASLGETYKSEEGI